MWIQYTTLTDTSRLCSCIVISHAVATIKLAQSANPDDDKEITVNSTHEMSLPLVFV